MARVSFALAVLALAAGALAQQSISGGQDGNLDQCQAILGSQPLGDGTFDRDNDFSAYIAGGWWSVPLSSILNSTGDVLYIVPAPMSMAYTALTPSTAKTAGYCYDTTTLLPQYNPLAVTIPSDVNGTVQEVVVSPLSTVAVFGTAFGLTEFTLDLAFGLDPATDVSYYNFIFNYQTDPSGMAAEYYKESTKVDNVVTVGATLLANTTDAYASFAVLMYQAIARQALNSSSIIWNNHLLNETEPAMDLNNAQLLYQILNDAAGHVTQTKDYLLPSQLNVLTPDQFLAAATGAANLNILVDSAADNTTFAKAAYYSHEKLAPMVMDLADGTTSTNDFLSATNMASTQSAMSSLMLPSNASSSSTSSMQSGTSSSQSASSGSSGSSHLSGGKIAGAVIGSVVGAALIALVAGLLIRRNGSGQGMFRRNRAEQV